MALGHGNSRVPRVQSCGRAPRAMFTSEVGVFVTPMLIPNFGPDLANKLSSWTFTNLSVASIYKLQGVVCWNEKKNRLINL